MKSLHLSKPHLLVVVGIPGAGKSFFAEKFADTFKVPYIHYQAIQTTAETPLGEQETAELAGLMYQELVKTDQTIILEGPGTSRTERDALARLARQAHYEPLFIWVQTEPATAEKRAVQGIRGSSNLKITKDQFDNEIKRFTPLHKTEKSVVISGKHTYASQAKIVLKRLIEPNLEARRSTPTIMAVRPAGGRITIQ